jgi:outer membrane protein assembly factor BamB
VEDGALLWSHPFTNDQSTVCAQPVLVPDTDRQILLGLGYGRGSTLIEVSQADDGTWQTREIWTSRDMKTKFTTAVIRDGYAYGLDDGILACIDLATGQRQWKKGRYQHGQVLLVGGWLLIQAEAGDLVLVNPSPEGPQEAGRIEALNEKTWNNPALTAAFLLLRNSSEAVCYRIAEERGL